MALPSRVGKRCQKLRAAWPIGLTFCDLQPMPHDGRLAASPTSAELGKKFGLLGRIPTMCYGPCKTRKEKSMALRTSTSTRPTSGPVNSAESDRLFLILPPASFGVYLPQFARAPVARGSWGRATGGS